MLQLEQEVTLPGEGKDRTFVVSLRYMTKIDLYGLEEALQGRVQRIPGDAVQALDTILRHLPSMT